LKERDRDRERERERDRERERNLKRCIVPKDIPGGMKKQI
jgi:hypothetical protein